MGKKYSKVLQNDLANEFYQSCCNGDVNSVRELLPILTYDQVNYVDPATRRTSLHAACSNNHHEIVRLLLENNVCNRIIRNQENKTAYDVAPSADIRALFSRPRHRDDDNRFVSTCENDSPFRLITNSTSSSTRPDNWVTGYFSSADAHDAQLMLGLSRASPIMKLLLYGRTERESKNLVQRLIEINIPITHEQYQRTQELFQNFLHKKFVKSLLTLYSLNTPLYEALQSNGDAYTVLLYLHLHKLADCAYRGTTYRGMAMSLANLQAYRWAHEHAAIIETRTIQSTSICRAVAEAFAGRTPDDTRISAIMRYKFIQTCSTAINLHKISHFSDEEEVLLLPFTLFRVVSIKECNENTVQQYEITMANIPVVQNSLWASSRKRNKRQ